MKLRDFVVNSLPRVRSKKKTRGLNQHPESSNKNRHEPTPRQPSARLSSVSRESSVERASHVAVADAGWRQSPPRNMQDEVALVGALSYYPPPSGMVISRSAEGISSHSLAVKTPRYPTPDFNGPYSHNMAAISETTVNYSMPMGFVLQSQHHHRHNHQHDHHYVYHHHHHHQYPSDPSSRAPLGESNINHHQNRCKVPTCSRKSEPGFLRKSFASFKAMRKQRSNGKDSAAKPKVGDENGKCSVCPYPQLHAMATDVKKSNDTRPAKPKRKGLKSLRKSKQNQEDPMDKSWFSDNDASNASSYHLSEADLFHNTTTPRSRFRECSVESCMSRINGSQDSSYGAEADYRALDSNSLSGYESDLPKTKAGRTRSRIKTNPWLPSPQPSLNIGRRIAQCDFRESREDVMTVDDDMPSMPRSASFEYQRSTVLSSFQPSSSNGRSIQRHRSLTPSDLKITYSDSKTSSGSQSSSSSSSQRTISIRNDNGPMNDLSSTETKSRPSSILSPTSEFVMLADNIEQLANNISFEYEEMCDTTLESVTTFQEDGKISIQELLSDDELNGSGKNKESVFSSSDHANSNAHSPDSGIGCLGSSDGDELVISGAISNEQSSLSSSGTCITSSENTPDISPREVTNSICHVSDISNISENADTSSLDSSEPRIDITGQNVQCHFVTHLKTTTNCLSSPSSGAVCSLSEKTSTSNAVLAQETPICESTYLEKLGNARGNVENGEKLGVNASSQKNDTSHGNLLDAQVNLPDMCGQSNSAIEVQSPSHDNNSLCSVDFNSFQENGIRGDFLGSRKRTMNAESNQLPPNIIRSEFPTPVESPTENWQCDSSFLEHLSSGAEQTEVRFSQREDLRRGRQDETTSIGLQDNRQISLSSDSLRANEKLTVQCAGEIFEKSDGPSSYSTENNSIDCADASVQTDFNEEDLNSWNNDKSHTLEDLCEYEFDPIESTRRWLLTGNMQGSADTGYSSQPRDSQILMDDDESIAGDILADNTVAPPKRQLPGGDGTGTIMKLDLDVATNEKGDIKNTDEIRQSRISQDKQRTQPEDLVHSMFSGIESQFKDIFNQLWPAQAVPQISGNKRDSSGSSTSTLISESIGGASISDSITNGLDGFDDLTPRNSGCGNAQLKKGELNNHEIISHKKASKKKKTVSSLEPDYVNIPRKGRSNKTNGCHFYGMAEAGNKENSAKLKKCTVRSYPRSEQNIDPSGPFVTCPKSSTSWKDKAHPGSTERADYLEFLRDAPLGNAHYKRPMFLIPGFGPIDMSSASLSLMANDDWASGPANVRQDYPISKAHANRLYGMDSNGICRAQARLSEGRSGAKSRSTQDRDPRDSPISSSSDKRHPVEEGPPKSDRNFLPEKPKRKNPRAIQTKPCPTRTPQWKYSPLAEHIDQEDLCHKGNPVHAPKTTPHQLRSYPDNSTRGIAERVWQLQREKDLIYSQLREVQQEELSRQRQQLQHQRNVHSQRKDILLQTLRELKTNLEEQSRQLNLKCNQDVII